MAESEVTPLHNIQAINDEISKIFKEVLANENYLSELIAENITPVKADIKEQWGNLKASTDMDLAELKLLFKIYKRQEDAKNFDDEDDRARVADNLRTAFAALAAGGMLDFLDVLDTEHEPATVAEAREQEEAEAVARAAEEVAAGDPDFVEVEGPEDHGDEPQEAPEAESAA